jgi:gluconate 2-dehydrogenase gamma chain
LLLRNLLRLTVRYYIRYPLIPNFCYLREKFLAGDLCIMAEQQSDNVLTAEESKILSAVAERIFPRTDTPGAVEIGAVGYIEMALAGDYAALLPLYRQGLRALERCAQMQFARRFDALAEAQKDTVLTNFESGAVPGFAKAAEFFETVRYHVLEGVFCEPHYGGNRDMIGWRLVNFPGQQFGYADPYINRAVDLEPVAVDPPKTDEK